MSGAGRGPAPRRAARALAAAALALAALAALALAAGWWRFGRRLGRRYDVAAGRLGAAEGEAARARGEHLARTVAGCAECHGDDFGGRALGDDALLRLVAPNITRGAGGVVRGYEDADWERAILHGVAPGGRPLVVMPSYDLRSLDDRDVAAVVAFCRALPPVDRAPPPTEVKPFGRALAGLLGLPLLDAERIDHAAPRRAAARPEPGPTRAYGAYLKAMCVGCHGPDFRGGVRHGPDEPPSADISPAAMAGWRYEEFVAALREGRRRDGSPLHPAMPWRSTSRLTDDELTALWLGLREP